MFEEDTNSILKTPSQYTNSSQELEDNVDYDIFFGLAEESSTSIVESIPSEPKIYEDTIVHLS
jgi:hypothetical protein